MRSYNPQTKYDKPTRDELENLIDKHDSTSKAAQAFGCSRGTIQRWAHMYDIPLKSNKGGGCHRERGRMLPKSVPTRIFGPILKDLIDKYETSQLMDGTGIAKKLGGDFTGGKTYLIFPPDMPVQYRVPARTITAITTQERPGVKFETADKILCWMDANYLWHRPPLNEFYWEGAPIPECGTHGQRGGLDGVVAGLVQMHFDAQGAKL
jgi:hypothetical protein